MTVGKSRISEQAVEKGRGSSVSETVSLYRAWDVSLAGGPVRWL